MIKVTLAFLRNSRNQILLARRSVEKSFGGLWEFPGGKFEEGENAETCIKREIREELKIDISVLAVVNPYQYKIDDENHITFYPVFCSWETGSIELIEHEEVGFFSLEEISSLDLAPPDYEALEKLKKLHYRYW